MDMLKKVKKFNIKEKEKFIKIIANLVAI